MQMRQFPQQINYKKPFSSLLAVSAFWKEAIFDRAAGGISRSHVDSLFLSSTASGMLQMNFRNPTFKWIVARGYGGMVNNCFIENHIGRPIYKRDDVWVGIHLFSEQCVRQHDVSLLIDDN